jgi:hypothetical protein
MEALTGQTDNFSVDKWLVFDALRENEPDIHFVKINGYDVISSEEFIFQYPTDKHVMALDLEQEPTSFVLCSSDQSLTQINQGTGMIDLRDDERIDVY